MMLKQTPLHPLHQVLNARLIDFGGWDMPVQYKGIIEEHLAVRKACGLFDISHMGEVFISGPGAADFLNRTLTNDIRSLAPGKGQYTLMCNEQGGVVDDLYLYQIGPEQYFLIINASRIEPDLAWLGLRVNSDPMQSSIHLDDRSPLLGAVAVQGPAVRRFIDECFLDSSSGPRHGVRPSALAKNEIERFSFAGQDVWVACTGYTGEDGFEVVAPNDSLAPLWNRFMAAGAAHGLAPCGLGARDTLRTEMGYPLYGHELDEHTTPIEAGLGVFVALNKGDFVGREVLARQKHAGTSRKCVAFRMTERSAPPRPGYSIWLPGDAFKAAGIVVSGTQSPSLGIGIGMGYVPVSAASPGAAIQIEIRGRRSQAEIVLKSGLRKKPI